MTLSSAKYVCAAVFTFKLDKIVIFSIYEYQSMKNENVKQVIQNSNVHTFEVRHTGKL